MSTIHEDSVVIDTLQHSNWDRERFEQLREGGLTAVHVTLAIWENTRQALQNVAGWYRWLREHGDLIALVQSADDIERAKREGRTGVILGFQNCSPFEDDLAMVEIFHRLGIRIAQVTYNIQNHVGSSCYEPVDSGLSRFGRNVVAEMNRLGMVVDLSHAGERTTLDSIEHSARPVAVTHANPLAFQQHPRNKSDEVLRKLAARGGILGCSPYPHVFGEGHSSAAEWADAVAYAADLMGPEHVGVGTDSSFNWPDEYLTWIRNGTWTFTADGGASLTGETGWPTWPEFYSSPADFPNLTQALLDRGFSDAETSGIMGGNWLRFFREGFEPAQ
jgi:membrane dipeptidase